MGGREAAATSRAKAQEMLKEQNDELIEGLEVKTSALKQVALEIGKEVTESNTLLERMGSTFQQAQSMLTKSHEQLQRVAKQARSPHMCYMVSFTFVLLLLYFLTYHRGT